MKLKRTYKFKPSANERAKLQALPAFDDAARIIRERAKLTGEDLKAFARSAQNLKK